MDKQFEMFHYLYNEADFYIPMDTLETGGLYWIIARNAHVGVWFNHAKGFVIPREKFDREYLFVEYHWDTYDRENFPFATVKPFELIEMAPFKIEDFFTPTHACIGWTLKKQNDMPHGLLEYLLKKSDEFSFTSLLKKYSKV
ncbi:MAG: hypothetical protein HQK76_10385 [Desulfobacterales bacterium]|nr:hypothetical protein [Desulfobacterales bacterium]